MATSDIEIAISVESLADHFLISPNALHRGEGEYAGLTLHERGMLAALLTLHPGAGRQWNTSRAGINDLAPELGRDKITSILNGLNARGYLYKRRVNMGAGRFRWEWRVFMKARPQGFDPFADVTPTIDGEHVNGDEQPKPDVSAGHTIDGSLGPNRTSPKEGSSSRSTRSTSPLPPAPTAPAIEAGAVPGEETPTDEDTAIQAAVRAAIAHQPTWRPAAVRAAIHQAIAEGLPAPVAHRVIVELAEGNTWGPTTAGPQRIIARGPWWTPGAVFVPAPPKDTKAECGRHPGQPARSCACCASERLEATPAKATPPTVAGVPDEARDLFSRIPALRRPRPAQRRTAPAGS